MTTTGYSDTFGRTVSNGLGVATSGQTYTLMGVATQFNVAPNVATILPSSTGDKAGYIDLQTQNVDITAQVALSAVPATNLATVGFFSKLSTASNYFNATMMVAAGGAVSLRFSKVVAGSLSTISTTAVAGLTYVANTFYNLRYAIAWSRALQTNVMTLKLWAIGAAEPGGWMATATDASFTDYTSGTQVGIMGRDESAVLGSVTAKIQNVLVRSYSLPMPATTDPMCFDPAVTYPKQTDLQFLASAADTAMASIDPLTSLAGLFPRVRVSNSNLSINSALVFIPLTFNTTEFNIGTPTDLGFDSASIRLPVGIWAVTFEIQLAEAASNSLALIFSGGPLVSQITVMMRSNAAQTNDQGVGGCGHASFLAYATNPASATKFSVMAGPNSVSAVYTAKYLAMTAVKISDYFV